MENLLRRGERSHDGKSEPTDNSAQLAFSPNVNGISKLNSGQEQEFVASLVNGGIDPINVFPLGPSNDDGSESNNYSPLWNAHISLWTPKAIQEGKVQSSLFQKRAHEAIRSTRGDRCCYRISRG